MAGMKEGEVIESGMLTRQIEKAQRKVEAHNFDVRKQLLTFDDVANDQRKVIYQQRTELMGADSLGDAVRGIRAEVVSGVLDQYLLANVSHEEWNLQGLAEAIAKNFATQVDPVQWLKDTPDLEEEALRGRILGAIDAMYDAKVARIGNQSNGVPIMRHIEKDIMLKVLDQQWRDHLGAMDYLRQGIHLRGYAQKDYRYEYKREAFELFAAMLERIKFDTVTILATLDVQIKSPEQIEREEEARRARVNRALQLQHAEAASFASPPQPEQAPPQGGPPGARPGSNPMPPMMPPRPQQPQQPVRVAPKVGRNQPCPCGSGKKFKNCHGVLEGVE
jgi:preprotein translocase subunit SecA